MTIRENSVPATLALVVVWGCSAPAGHVREEARSMTVGEMVFRRISPGGYGQPEPDFYLLETEVTNEQYLGFLLSTSRTKDETPPVEPEGSLIVTERRKGYESENPFVFQVDRGEFLWKDNRPPPGGGDLPVSLITVQDAKAFCAWLNSRYPDVGTFRLPTQKEWLLAAYGAGRACPWGMTKSNPERLQPAPGPESVRQHPEARTPEGLYGMWGNVGEFVQPGPAMLPGLPYRDEAIWMGGSYADPEPSPRREASGSWIDPHGRSQRVGFRVLLEPVDSPVAPSRSGEKR